MSTFKAITILSLLILLNGSFLGEDSRELSSYLKLGDDMLLRQLLVCEEIFSQANPHIAYNPSYIFDLSTKELSDNFENCFKNNNVFNGNIVPKQIDYTFLYNKIERVIKQKVDDYIFKSIRPINDIRLLFEILYECSKEQELKDLASFFVKNKINQKEQKEILIVKISQCLISKPSFIK